MMVIEHGDVIVVMHGGDVSEEMSDLWGTVEDVIVVMVMMVIYHGDGFVSEEMSDLRVQLKMLEEKNTHYMQQQIEMEEVCVLCVCVCACMRVCVHSCSNPH